MPQSLEELEFLAMTLRDFFNSRNADDLKRTGERLSAYVSPRGPTDWQAVEHDFNRLFVGPGVVPAPPYASVYLEPEPLLMGRSTLAVRELLHALGVAAPEGQPDDFIACELDAWGMLAALLKPGSGREELRAQAQDALLWLVEEHMGRWLPLFVARVREAGAPPVVEAALCCVEQWLRYSLQRRTYE